jgi:hypothetical protein
MKVNLKKIGAIVAGAAILASSVSFAGLMFGSTTLVDSNGAPVVKVVVGANAAASDGVAAALIASKIASAAYSTDTLTAAVSGTANCGGSMMNSTTASTTGSGSCTVSDQTATLAITVPGSVTSGTYTINNLIGDYLNRELDDRNLGQMNYSLGSDTADDANPFTLGTNSGTLGPTDINLFRISGDMFSPFATATLTDQEAAVSYVEQQDMWISGDNHYEDTPNTVVGAVNDLAYTIKFKGVSDDLGIPVCTTPSNTTDYSQCDEDYQTATHKMDVNFLGDQWVISDMEPPTTPLTTETTLVAGGEIKLAKESVAGILNQGQSLTADGLQFRLDDLEAISGNIAAIVSVLDANGNVQAQDTIAPGETKEFEINGNDYRFHVYKVAPGYTFGAKWADVAVYSQELQLQSGEKLDPNYNTNPYWTVYLGWKNEGASSTDTLPDHLRTIVLYAQGSDIQRLSSGGQNYLSPGDYLPIVQDPVSWKLTYSGLDLGASDRDDLSFDLERSSDLTLSGTNNGPYIDGSGQQATCVLTAPYVHVTSGRTGSVFSVQSASGATYGSPSESTSDEFYVATNGANCSVTDGNSTALAPGSVFIAGSTSSDASWTYANYAGPQMQVLTPVIGDGDQTWALGGVIEWTNWATVVNATTDLNAVGEFGNVTSGTQPSWIFGISEKAGTGVSNDFSDQFVFGLYVDATSTSTSTFNIDSYTTGSQQLTKDDVGYVSAGPVAATGSYGNYQEGFTSERGSEFNSISDAGVDFDMANTLAHAQWVLASSAAANETPGTTVWTGGIGDSTNVNGVTVQIQAINQTSVCTATGGAASCSVADMSPVSAVIVQDGAQVPSATTMTPYDFTKYSPLVILDQDAAGVSTVISVGGDAVNTVTASILAGTPNDWNANPQMVKEVVKGSKIVVAGATAADTTAAANTFISELVST